MKLFRILFFGSLGLYMCTFCAGTLAINLIVPVTVFSDVWGAGHLFGYHDAVARDKRGNFIDYDEAGLFTGGPVTWSDYVGPTSFICGAPVEQGYVTSGFDDVRVTNDGHEVRHGGIDYGTHQRELPVGTPMGGEVVYAGWSDVGYGLLVVVENDGVQQYLAHLAEIDAAIGDIVAAGDTVGISGNTGNSSGPHVHVEFRQQVVGEDGIARGVPFDPYTNFVPGQTAPCGWDVQWQAWKE